MASLFVPARWLGTRHRKILTNAARLRAAPGAVAFAESGRRADQDERRGAAEGDLRLVDEAPPFPETARWSSGVTAKLGCENRPTTGVSSWEKKQNAHFSSSRLLRRQARCGSF